MLEWEHKPGHLSPQPVLSWMQILYRAPFIETLVLKYREKVILNTPLVLLAGVFQGKFFKLLLLEMMHVKHLGNQALG